MRRMGPSQTHKTRLAPRLLVAWLGLHALLLQLVLPVLHHPAHVFATPRDIAAALVAMGDMGLVPSHAEHHGTHDSQTMPDCPLCLAIQHAAPFVPPTAPTLVLPTQHVALLPASHSDNAPHWRSFAARARAPPSQA